MIVSWLNRAGSMSLRGLVAFGKFWYGFVIGDDWTVAAAVAAALVVTWLLHTAGRVDLLGQQADIVDGGHGTLERRGGGLDLAGQRLCLRQQERAQQEGPLRTGEAVRGPVPVHQSTLVSEPLSDGIDGRFHPRVIAWQESGDS